MKAWVLLWKMIKAAPKLHVKILFSHFSFMEGIFAMHWQRVLFNSSHINGPGVFLILTFQKTTTCSKETKTKNVFWTRAFVYFTIALLIFYNWVSYITSNKSNVGFLSQIRMDGPAWNTTSIPLLMLQRSSNQLSEQQLLSRKCNVCVLKLRILHQKMGSQIVVSENRRT